MNEHHEVEARAPSNLEVSEAQPTIPINGIVLQLTPPASTTQVPITRSYASMVDPDEGTDLKFMPARTINDVAEEIEYWQQSIFCSVLGANPPFEVMQGFIKRIWSALDIDKIIHVRGGGADSLSKIGSLLGIPIKTDRFTKERSVIRYARLLIDIPLNSSFPKFIEFFNDNELLIRQHVVYEWKPVKCSHCHMFGHKEPVCKKKNVVRKEWRKV
ncbi:hypothetical protein Cgig2_028996 [Carnegiea gigantea]|uniref:DUF4283 domain-containing protein n=1 Tax=Carnegiea gigantea TaxID=171969 RepID=A0A9Q1Q9N6_9CARY|nr:hypothetical protein Cgig2_028996 [Carnegiea gigantea]